MSHTDAHNLLDLRKAGANLPQHLINKALELTGDIDDNDIQPAESEGTEP